MAESSASWLDSPFFAPSIIITLFLAGIAALIKYLDGKKSNTKEARVLEEDRIDRADAKDVKEKSDAKALSTEKTLAATVLKADAETEAIKVKKDTNERMDNKFKFSDQEHAHQHSELSNKLEKLDTKIDQVNKDLKTHLRTEHKIQD